MKLKEVLINNFRGIRSLHLKLNSPTTILIGENNTGKTTILEAIRKVLDRTRISSKNTFSEHDYFSEDETGGLDNEIVIELWFREAEEGEWNEEITGVELENIVQVDALTGLYNLGIRLKSEYDSVEKISNSSWFWLGNDGNELREIKSNSTTFFKIVQFFYLSALRDANTSFSSSSRLWNEFLRLKLTDEQEKTFLQRLKTLNTDILSSDDKIAELKNKLNALPSVVSNDIGSVSIQAFPEKPWDLSKKATLMISTTGSQVELPLARFGQGTQSLSVLMLFKAYTEVLMREKTHEQAFSILGLEEPEVHLHPQAIRSLWSFLNEKLTQQKIISTHSTFLIQEADLRSLRLLKRNGNTVKVYAIQQEFEIHLPHNTEIVNFCDTKTEFTYNPIGTDGKLVLKGCLENVEYNTIKKYYTGNAAALEAIEDLKLKSAIYLSDNEVLNLKYYTERLRGEIFFAKAWLLCEGQTEYLLLRYFAQVMNKNLDKNGISVIDYKNNASAGLFVVLAKHFDMPWLLISDNDSAYEDTKQELTKKKIPASEINGVDSFVKTYDTPNTDIETFLYDNGFKDDYLEILTEHISFTTNPSKSVFQTNNKKDKKTARLIFKNDGKFEIRIDVSANIQTIITQTNGKYTQLYQQIMKKKKKNETYINELKNNTDFSTQTEKELLDAEVGNIDYEVWKNQDGTYKVNLSVYGQLYTIENNHDDYNELLRYPIIKMMQKEKILYPQKLIRKLQKENITEERVPTFFKDCINQILNLV
ncbi:MAG: ATP-dependent nuclease [Chitinophagales bacterium]